MRRLALLTALLASLAAAPAMACSYAQMPEEVGDTSAQFFARAMTAAATYVDLVLVEDDGVQPMGAPPTGILTLRSIARLKGSGPDRFSLFGHGLTLQPEAERIFNARPMHFTRDDGRVTPFPYNEERPARLFPDSGLPFVSSLTSCSPPPISGQTGRFYVVMRGADGRLLRDFALYDGTPTPAFAFVPVTLERDDHWLKAVRLATLKNGGEEMTVLHLRGDVDPARVDAVVRRAGLIPVAAFVDTAGWIDEVRPSQEEAASPWLQRAIPLVIRRSGGGIAAPDHGGAEFLRGILGNEQRGGGLGYEVAQAFIVSVRQRQAAIHATPRLVALALSGPPEAVTALSREPFFDGVRATAPRRSGLPPLPGHTEAEHFSASQAIERDIWLLNGGDGNPQGTLPPDRR